MVHIVNMCTNYFKVLAEKLHHCEWISAQVADSVKDEYEEFIKLTFLMSKGTFSQFEALQTHIDKFLKPYLNENYRYTSL